MKKITVSKINEHLGFIPFEFEIFDVIDSTNKYARENLCHRKVVIAHEQTMGRGRMGRSFYSPKNNGIYMSVILKVDKSYDELELFTVAVAAITLKAIEKVSGKKCYIKWVNDIFIDEKKVCGILCENVLSKNGAYVEYVVVGIGINVSSCDSFPEELKNIAGAVGNNVSGNELVAEILKGVDELSKNFNFKKYLSFYRENSLVIGKTIMFTKDNRDYKGRVKEINDYGNLEVKLEDGRNMTIKSGEIRLGINNIC